MLRITDLIDIPVYKNLLSASTENCGLERRRLISGPALQSEDVRCLVAGLYPVYYGNCYYAVRRLQHQEDVALPAGATAGLQRQEPRAAVSWC